MALPAIKETTSPTTQPVPAAPHAPPASHAHTPRDTDYFLPPGYQAQTVPRSLDEYAAAGRYWTPERIAASSRYQQHVYLWAAKLISRSRAANGAAGSKGKAIQSVLDIGCGPATKLTQLIVPLCPDVEGIDQPSAVRDAMERGQPGRFTPANLEDPSVSPWRQFDLIICADVVEHLLNPDPMLQLMRRFAHHQTLMLFSTPERRRLRGRGCLRCDKPDHVREWARDEFLCFLRSRGFDVLASRLMPQDDSPCGQHLLREACFRLRCSSTSTLCCHAVLCRCGGPGDDVR